MNTTGTGTPYAISAWSAVSPYGIGAKAFTDGIRQGSPDPVRLDDGYPDEYAFPVPDFEIRTVLGSAGTRSMDRCSALAVTAIRELVESVGRDRIVGDETGIGLVLGTTTGSPQCLVELTTEMLVNAKPFYVNPSLIPNAVINGAAAQCAIWHQLKGPNATIGGGRVAGLLALRYAIRLLAAGRARAMLWGGVEEFSAPRAWLEHHTRAAAQPAAARPDAAAEPAAQPDPAEALGEGAGVLLLEPADQASAPVLAEVLAVESGVFAPGQPSQAREALVACARRALSRSGVAAADLRVVSSAPLAGPLREAESAAVEQVFAGRRPDPVPAAPPWGDAGATTVPFQVAAVLAATGQDADTTGRAALITAVDRDGLLGCALLRLCGADR